jgi:D-erythronate 2-dehydrogenase
MKVVILGGHGFLGQMLAQRLLQKGCLMGSDNNNHTIDELVLVDQVPAQTPLEGVTSIIGDINDPAFLSRIIDDNVTSIFHLAAVVSAAAEADFDLGMAVNLDATRSLLERCRALPKPPRLVFSSSLAVFGNAPAMVEDDTLALPLSSYGVQKVIGEYLTCEYTRRNYIDGRCVRLPTITIRPGKPNRAASSFISSILREPLQGLAAVCPVAAEMQLWVQSPRTVIENLIRAHDTPTAAWSDGPRILNLPGLTVSVTQMVEALKAAGGDVGLISWQRDQDTERLVGSWPGAMNTVRADKMGFKSDNNIEGIIDDFIRDIPGTTKT